MKNLTVINISLKDRTKYNKFIVKFHIGEEFFSTIPQLEIFRVRTQGEITFSADALQVTNHLRVLDFTRTKYLELRSFYGSVENQSTSIEALTLKNVQALSPTGKLPYIATVDLSKIVCPLSNTLRRLDLSHNDIQAIVLSKTIKCVYWLDELDLSYNLIIDTREDTNPTFYSVLFPLLLGIRVLHGDHMWSEHDIDSHLWKDSADYEENAVEQRPMSDFSALAPLIPPDFLAYLPLAGYVTSWLEEMKQYCPALNTDLLCLFRSTTHAGITRITCPMIKCLFPHGSQKCNDPHADYNTVIEILAEQCKDLQHCDGNMLIPVASTTEFYINHISGPHSLFQSSTAFRNENHTADTLCFASNNDLQILDLSYSEAYYLKQIEYNDYFMEKQDRITGLHKLRILNAQSVILPLRVGPRLVSDMPALEEVHVGGNQLTDDDKPLPAAYFQNKPNLKLVNLSHANLLAIEYNAFIDNPKLQTLDLSSNRLNEQTFLFDISTSNLSTIRLNDNRIASIHLEMREQLSSLHNLELDLSDNPLRCDCTTMEFVHWAHKVKEHIKFINPETYFCVHTVGGSTLFTVDLAAMRTKCETWRSTVLIVMTTLLGVVLVICIVTAVRKRWLIRHFLFTVQEKMQMRREDRPVEEYQFDAFVLYSSELADRRWVHEQLVKTMEETYGFKLCIHLRNFIGGEDILDNVEMAIKKSRKVIAVISPNFVRSGWCMDELQMTRTVEQEESRRKLIVILLEDFPGIPANIPPVIRLILEQRTYLEWQQGEGTEKHFWKRLNKALYTKSKPVTTDIGLIEL